MTTFEKKNLYKFHVDNNNSTFRFDNVTLEYPSLFSKTAYKDAKETYNTKVLINYENNKDVYGNESSMVNDVETIANIIALEHSDPKRRLSKIKSSLDPDIIRFPLNDGTIKAENSDKHDYYKGCIYFNAKESARPKVFVPLKLAESLGEDFDKEADELMTIKGSQAYLIGADSPNTQLFYSGSICNVVVSGYVYAGSGGTGLSFYLKDVVLKELGEKRGGGSISDSVLEGFLD